VIIRDLEHKTRDPLRVSLGPGTKGNRFFF